MKNNANNSNNTHLGADRNNAAGTSYFDDPNPENIEKEINITRSRMDNTIDRLSDKLNPSAYMDDAVSWMKDRANTVDTDQLRESFDHARQRTADFAKENPVPLALLGLTVASLFVPKSWFSKTQSTEEVPQNANPYPEPVYDHLQPTAEPGYESVQPAMEQGDDQGHSKREKIREIASDARDQAHQAWESTSSKAGEVGNKIADVADRTKYRVKSGYSTARNAAGDVARNTGERFSEGREQFPLVMGLGFAAAGILAGLALPGTRKEDEKLGEQADQLKRSAKQRARSAVKDACEQTKEKASELGIDPESLKEKTEEVLTDARSKAEDTIEDKLEGQSPS